MIFGTNYNFYIACKKNKESKALKLLEKHPNIKEYRGRAGNTALFHACENHMLDVIDKLLDNPNFNCNNVNIYNTTIYQRMVSMNIPSRLVLKLISKPQFNYRYIIDGCTTLLFACRHGYQDVGLHLIDRGGLDYNATDVFKMSALSYACGKKLTSIALRLLDIPHIIYNMVDKRGKTPLIYSCTHKLTEVIMKILDKTVRDGTIISYNDMTTIIQISKDKGLEDVTTRLTSMLNEQKKKYIDV